MHSESWWVKPEGLSLECRVGYLELRRLKLKYTWQLTPCFSVYAYVATLTVVVLAVGL